MQCVGILWLCCPAGLCHLLTAHVHFYCATLTRLSEAGSHFSLTVLSFGVVDSTPKAATAGGTWKPAATVSRGDFCMYVQTKPCCPQVHSKESTKTMKQFACSVYLLHSLFLQFLSYLTLLQRTRKGWACEGGYVISQWYEIVLKITNSYVVSSCHCTLHM